jgi:hypothetical protein
MKYFMAIVIFLFVVFLLNLFFGKAGTTGE